MSASSQLALEYSWPNGKAVELNEVDAWELKASRRALENLKSLLVGQPMLDLLKDQLDASDAYYKDIIAESNGQYKESRIDLKAKGISLAQWMDWWKVWLMESSNPETKQKNFMETMIPAHPEHYTTPPYPGGIVETIGGHVARVRIAPSFDPPDFVRAYGDPTYQPMSAIGTLDNGSILFYILQEVRDCEGGCEFHLRLLFPSAAPQNFFDEHAEHLAVEYRTFVRQAFERSRR